MEFKAAPKLLGLCETLYIFRNRNFPKHFSILIFQDVAEGSGEGLRASGGLVGVMPSKSKVFHLLDGSKLMFDTQHTFGRSDLPCWVDKKKMLDVSRQQASVSLLPSGECEIVSLGSNPTLVKRGNSRILLYSVLKTKPHLLPADAEERLLLCDGDAIGLLGSQTEAFGLGFIRLGKPSWNPSRSEALTHPKFRWGDQAKSPFAPH